jgi:hypothetical protein
MDQQAQKLTYRFHSLMPTKMMNNLHLTHAQRRAYLLIYHGKGLASRFMKILTEKKSILQIPPYLNIFILQLNRKFRKRLTKFVPP